VKGLPALCAGLAAAWLCGCAAPQRPLQAQVVALLPPLLLQTPQLLLLGEQHDAPEHQLLERETVTYLLRQGQLGALALEMAERGTSTTALLPHATETQVQQALNWNEAGWPWASYGPTVMLAVREGVPVLGANLPRTQQRNAMNNEAIDALLTNAALLQQQQRIETSHCGMLAPMQLRPMTRIQIARDQAMAQTLVDSLLALSPSASNPTPSNTKPLVLLLAGEGHVQRELGVPLHLPPTLRVATVQLNAGGSGQRGSFDSSWPTAPAPPKDYCADFKASRSRPSVRP
jgi:uncharacterized iron-regulated protein